MQSRFIHKQERIVHAYLDFLVLALSRIHDIQSTGNKL